MTELPRPGAPVEERELLDEQIHYYRQRAGEYDQTAYGDLDVSHIRATVDWLDPRGAGLEIACGTGMWTRELAGRFSSLHALDAAPEAIAIARSRVPADAAFTFDVADAFAWTPPVGVRYDCVFLGFFLSHVPAERWAPFLSTVSGWLTDGGRLLMVDEHVGRAAGERFDTGTGRSDVALRTLNDGSRHRLVKVYVDPAQLRETLAGIGWSADVETVDDDDPIADWLRARAWRR